MIKREMDNLWFGVMIVCCLVAGLLFGMLIMSGVINIQIIEPLREELKLQKSIASGELKCAHKYGNYICWKPEEFPEEGK